MVVATVNHRLNAFGYLHLGELDPRYPASGNVGQLDLVQALQRLPAGGRVASPIHAAVRQTQEIAHGVPIGPAQNGMPDFTRWISEAEAEAIRAYVAGEAQQLYREERAG